MSSMAVLKPHVTVGGRAYTTGKVSQQRCRQVQPKVVFTRRREMRLAIRATNEESEVNVAATSSSQDVNTNSKISLQQLGKSDVQVSSVGVGVWSWGDKYWGYGDGYGEKDVEAAFDSCMESGLSFLDTAEVYGFGESEKLTGKFIASSSSTQKPQVATKFAPLPWRCTAGSVVDACRASLDRLKVEKVELYMQHWPVAPFLDNVKLPFQDTTISENILQGLADCYKLGLCDAVGVSNFNAKRLREAHAFLAAQGVPLASNQVQYSLLYREPEKNGVKDVCEELGITLVAYSPFAQGLLTGKYSVSNGLKPSGPRQNVFTDQRLRDVEPLLDLMRTIGSNHGGKTPSQVALNWLICKGALPIPGVKTVKQVQETAGSDEGGWRLTEDEISQLDAASSAIKTNAAGAPFENW